MRTAEPTKEDLESVIFNAIWEVIKKWDISRGYTETGNRQSYQSATGTDVMEIINALKNKIEQVK